MDNQTSISGVRAASALVAAALFGLFGSLLRFSQQDVINHEMPDPARVMRAQDLLQPVVQLTPPRTRIGYFNEPPLGEVESLSGFFSAQYAVVPRVVVDEKAKPEPEWWIGSFGEKAEFAEIAAKRGLKEVKQLGNGIFLYRKEAVKP
jgi:hypothetical protein